MIGKVTGFGFSVARDFIARGLVRIRISPDAITLLGAVFMLAAGVCFALGSAGKFAWSLNAHTRDNAYLLLASGAMILAAACDMLDGAVAKIGNRKTIYGSLLDSVTDRFSDFAIYAGIVICFACTEPANITFMLLAMIAMANAFAISYVRARAENLIPSCPVGYWQRGERIAAILFASLAHNIPAMLIQQAISPAFTVRTRMRYAKDVLNGKSPITDPRKGGLWMKMLPWKWRRMTIPYDIITLLNIAWLIFLPAEKILIHLFGTTDVVRKLIESI